jgi:hypothetical protein
MVKEEQSHTERAEFGEKILPKNKLMAGAAINSRDVLKVFLRFDHKKSLFLALCAL